MKEGMEDLRCSVGNSLPIPAARLSKDLELARGGFHNMVWSSFFSKRVSLGLPSLRRWFSRARMSVCSVALRWFQCLGLLIMGGSSTAFIPWVYHGKS